MVTYLKDGGFIAANTEVISPYRNVQWFRGGLVFEAHRLLYYYVFDVARCAARDAGLCDVQRGSQPPRAI